MATKFYLPSSGTAPVSPAYNENWEDTSVAQRLQCYTANSGTTTTQVSFTDTDNTAKDILVRQYVSQPLAAQTIDSQTVTYQNLYGERASGNNLFSSLCVYIVNNTGTATVAAIVPLTRDAAEFDASLTVLENRSLAVTSALATCSAGDRIVIEIGAGGDPANTGGADHDFDLRLGDPLALLDLGTNDTDLEDKAPWVQFANTLSFRNVDYKYVYKNDTGFQMRIYSNDNASTISRSVVIATITSTYSETPVTENGLATMLNRECNNYGKPIDKQSNI